MGALAFGAGSSLLFSERPVRAGDLPSSPLPPRRFGELDIHHIDTGRGNCTLIVAPDGTSVMIDAGAASGDEAMSGTQRPDAGTRTGVSQARYAQRHLVRPTIDYLVATHIHPDHIGDVDARSPLSDDGSYRLTGVSDVDALLPIGTVIDRSFPDFGMLPPPAAPFAANYLSYLAARRLRGRAVERADIGSVQQIKFERTPPLPDCTIRILAARGVVWTGHGRGGRALFGRKAMTAGAGRPTENCLSTALRLTYGRFSYYTGGDLSCDTQDGQFPWLDVETPVSAVSQRTEVATANHHGYFDACGARFVQHLDPQAFIIQAWHVTHPGQAQLQRLLGDWPSARTRRAVFATDLLPANAALNARFVSGIRSRRGHVVVRVAAGGDSFRILICDSAVENAPVLADFGPYFCRRN